MSRTSKVVYIVIVAIVAVVVAVVWYQHPAGNNAGTVVGAVPEGSGGATSGAPMSSMRTAVPANVSVPNIGATSAPSGVAVPAVQGAGDSAGTVSYRSFNISVNNNAFSPATVIVNQGDTVNLEITAVDANYGFTQPNYGFNGVIMKGKTQRVQFEASQTGTFTFYCSSCGGPSKGPVGHIIVVALK